MPKILTIDSATHVCAIALSLNGKVYHKSVFAPQKHAELILQIIKELLQYANISIKDLDAIAVGAGPGSFTGVRLAISIAKGLAFPFGTKLIKLSNLEVLAQCAYQHTGQCDILCAIDARMNEIYTAFFKIHDNKITCLTGELVIKPEALQLNNNKLFVQNKGFPIDDILIAGDAYFLYEHIKRTFQHTNIFKPFSIAKAMLETANIHFLNHNFTDINQLDANYVRNPEFKRANIANN